VPLTRDPRVLDHFLGTCAGWLLTGGGDVAAKFYAPRMSAHAQENLGADEVRMKWRFTCCASCGNATGRVRNLPGIQVMNVAFGGTLLPHVAGHRNPQPDASRIKSSGRSKEVASGNGRLRPREYESSSGGRPRRAWFCSGCAARDGTIEAMEKSEANFCCAVQFIRNGL